MKLKDLLELVDVSLKVKIKIDGYIAEGSVLDIQLMDIKGIVKGIGVETIPSKKLVIWCDTTEDE